MTHFRASQLARTRSDRDTNQPEIGKACAIPHQCSWQVPWSCMAVLGELPLPNNSPAGGEAVCPLQKLDPVPFSRLCNALRSEQVLNKDIKAIFTLGNDLSQGWDQKKKKNPHHPAAKYLFTIFNNTHLYAYNPTKEKRSRTQQKQISNANTLQVSQISKPF